MSCDYEMVIWSMKTETNAGNTWRVMFGGVNCEVAPPSHMALIGRDSRWVHLCFICVYVRERESTG